MEDFFTYFWNWLTNSQKQKLLAPPAQERYKNSKKMQRRVAWYDAEGARQDTPQSMFGMAISEPAEIYRYVRNPGDTVYEELPETRDRYISKRSYRTASTKDPRGKEYEILKRRWNTAMNLAR